VRARPILPPHIERSTLTSSEAALDARANDLIAHMRDCESPNCPLCPLDTYPVPVPPTDAGEPHLSEWSLQRYKHIAMVVAAPVREIIPALPVATHTRDLLELARPISLPHETRP